MRAPGAVLLLSCYELGHQPLNLAMPLAYLRAAGYRPVAIDSAVQEVPASAIERAQLVAISVPMHTALRLGVRLGERIRRLNPQAHLCYFGLYAWLNRDYLLRALADSVIGGEFEQPLLGLVHALERGGPIVVPGVTTRERRSEPALVRVDFPIPAREALPAPRHYAHLVIGDRVVPAGYTETTRGCHHTCAHCPIVPVYRGRFFAIPRAVVLADIRQQVASGVGHITFGDPDFLNGPTHGLRICRALHEEFPQVTFDFTARIEHIVQHREMIPEFRRLGCVFIVSAVELLSDRVLATIRKGHTRSDVLAALRICDEAGIALRPSLLPFTPWTTLDDYLDLLSFIEEEELIEHIDPVHLAIRLLIPPGSALLDVPDLAPFLGPLDEANFTYTWRHPDRRMDVLHEAVAALAERATRERWDSYETFTAIRATAYRVAGRRAPAGPPRRRRTRPAPPRLTESWFC
ncbi:MAG: CUAEP/CCAEP-tail radical SAM protein [Thermomicrobium sp.]|nr:CUAEP/CCAEP-tail radical SAM protein [Thermomicrobium sp.]